jgi:hypothetical protein
MPTENDNRSATECRRMPSPRTRIHPLNDRISPLPPPGFELPIKLYIYLSLTLGPLGLLTGLTLTALMRGLAQLGLGLAAFVVAGGHLTEVAFLSAVVLVQVALALLVVLVVVVGVVVAVLLHMQLYYYFLKGVGRGRGFGIIRVEMG